MAELRLALSRHDDGDHVVAYRVHVAVVREVEQAHASHCRELGGVHVELGHSGRALLVDGDDGYEHRLVAVLGYYRRVLAVVGLAVGRADLVSPVGEEVPHDAPHVAASPSSVTAAVHSVFSVMVTSLGRGGHGGVGAGVLGTPAPT